MIGNPNPYMYVLAVDDYKNKKSTEKENQNSSLKVNCICTLDGMRTSLRNWLSLGGRARKIGTSGDEKRLSPRHSPQSPLSLVPQRQAAMQATCVRANLITSVFKMH